MKSLCCSFCHKLDKENDLGELFQASKIKRKKVYYHLNCVMYSHGILRKSYLDKNDYITHLYESSTKKECSMCGLSGPTLIYKYSGKIKEYYHYLCAERKGYIDKDAQLVKWLNFDEEIYINNKSSSTGEASHDIIETDDIDNSGIIKKRKRKNDDITSASSATFSEEEEDTEREGTYEQIGKKPRDENYSTIPEISSEECEIYFYKPEECDNIQQQPLVAEPHQENQSDSLSPPFDKINKDLLDISVPSLHYKEYEQQQFQQQFQQQQFQQQQSPPLPVPPQQQFQQQFQQQQFQQLQSPPPSPLPTPLLAQPQQQFQQQQFQQQQSPPPSPLPTPLPAQPQQQFQQQQSPPPSPQQQLSYQQNTNKIHSTPILKKQLQYILPQPHSPILASVISPQQQIHIQQQQKSRMLMTAFSSLDPESYINNNNSSCSKHILESQILKKKTKDININTFNNNIQSANSTSDIPISTSSPILIERSDNNSSSSFTSNNINYDYQIETDIDDRNKNIFTELYSSSNSSITYQLPPDSYTKSNNNSKDNSSKGIDYKSIFKYKNNGQVLKFTIYLDERDLLDVKITKNNKVVCDGVLVSVYGPSNYLDSLRSNQPMEIPIERCIAEEDFSNIFNDCSASQISLMRLIVKDYSCTCPLKILLTKLSKKNIVGYLDYNDFELFIIPNGMNIMKCPNFNVIIDRYMRNGPVIPAWVLLIAK